VTVLEVPPGVVVTLTFLFPVAAVAKIVHSALTVVAVGGVTVLMVQTTLPTVPDTFTAVAPDRLVPVRVTATGTPAVREPDVGKIEVSVGPTVNVTLLEVPPGVVVTLTVLFPVVAVAEIAHVALTVVAVGGVTVLMVQTTLPGVPDTFTAVVPDRLVPVRVIGTLVPRTPDVGAMEVSVGPTTVNVTVLLVRPSAVTLTLLGVSDAVLEITTLAVTVVAFTEVRVTVTPTLANPLIAVVPVRLVPLKTTLTVVPRKPVEGVIESRCGTSDPV
jgi:hypothetical protein